MKDYDRIQKRSKIFRAVIRREKEDEDPAFSYFMMEDTFTNIKDKYDISRIEKFQITRKIM